jgi:hypothetical protein
VSVATEDRYVPAAGRAWLTRLYDPVVAVTVRERRFRAQGGTLHVADWGRPHDPLMRAAFLVLQAIDGFSNTRDHAAGRLPSIIGAGGFTGVTTYARLRTAWGSLELLEAQSA